MRLAELTDHVEGTHHALCHRELPRLEEALTGAPDELREAFRELSAMLQSHLAREEEILFPAIRRLAKGEVDAGDGVVAAIREMAGEHGELRALEDRVRAIAHDAGDATHDLLVLLDDLAIHATREDDQLFPEAVAVARAASEPAPEGQPNHPVLATIEEALHFHGRFRRMLGTVDRKVLEAEPDKRFTAPWAHFTRAMREHFQEEELILFPALEALAEGERVSDVAFAVLLDEMVYELDVTMTLCDAVRSAARDVGDLEQEVLELLDELEEHARLEQEVLVPRARALVDGEQEQKAAPPPPKLPPSRRRGLLVRAAKSLVRWMAPSRKAPEELPRETAQHPMPCSH